MLVAGTSDYLWTDFLCLDQHNIAEISEQVTRMGDIYSQAEQVLMWLGHDQAGENAMEIIGNWPGEVQISYETMQLDQDWLTSTRLVEEKIDHDKILAAILHVLLRPYWKRIWIIQEAVLAKKAFLLYGKASMRLEEFRSRVDPFRHRRSEFRFGPNIWTICGLRERMGRKPLWELLINFENSVSTQRLDKIYGMLGLIADPYFGDLSSNPMLLQVNYQKSVHLVFWGTVFSSGVPWHRAYDFLLCMGRMFYEGGIDLWDFRHLEHFAASLTLDKHCHQSAKTALSAFHSMNLLFDTSGLYSSWEQSFQHLMVAFGHENDIAKTYIHAAPPMIGIVLATLNEHIHRTWQIR